jgi:hypothetical protein
MRLWYTDTRPQARYPFVGNMPFVSNLSHHCHLTNIAGSLDSMEVEDAARVEHPSRVECCLDPSLQRQFRWILERLIITFL